MPPLSYSLAGFHPGAYANHRAWIDDLRSLGFRWVTLTPTWLVHDEAEPRIAPTSGPTFDEIRAASAYARSAGMRVKLEPHLDWASTLASPPVYKWRRSMYLRPDGVYLETILLPLFSLAPDALTLGSELDVSAIEFAAGWTAVAGQLRAVLRGQKLNHDALEPGGSLRTDLNRERAKRSLSKVGRFFYPQRIAALRAYLADLDYASFSFYPDVSQALEAGEWRAPTTQAHVTAVANAFAARLDHLHWSRPAIGEFGLGCSDPAQPWNFQLPFDLTGAGTRELRCKFYLGFLEMLRSHAGKLHTEHPVTFWTVGRYDFLGTLNSPAFRDETLRQAIADFNREQSAGHG